MAQREIIRKDMLIGEVAMLHPDAIGVMMSYGLHCFGCGLVSYETLEMGCRGHGMSDEEIDALLNELNELFDTKDL